MSHIMLVRVALKQQLGNNDKKIWALSDLQDSKTEFFWIRGAFVILPVIL